MDNINNLPEEEKWLDMPSIPGAIASSFGRIKLPEKVGSMPHGGERVYKTKPIYGVIRRAAKTAKHKHYGIMYRKKNYKIHRLICEAFHGVQPIDKPVVIHINENGLDNRPDNLRWGTQKENMNMPKFIKYCEGRTGENSPTVKFRNKQTKSTT